MYQSYGNSTELQLIGYLLWDVHRCTPSFMATQDDSYHPRSPADLACAVSWFRHGSQVENEAKDLPKDLKA